MKTRTLMILIAADVFIFALICLGKVKRGECASSAAWDLKRNGKRRGRVAVSLIDGVARRLGDDNHCHKSWLGQKQIYTGEQ
jgi:hypothetical protein